MARKTLGLLSLMTGLASLIIVHAYGESVPVTTPFSSGRGDHFHEKVRQMQEFKASFSRRDLAAAATPGYAPAPSPQVIFIYLFIYSTYPFFFCLIKKMGKQFLVVVVVVISCDCRLRPGHVCTG